MKSRVQIPLGAYFEDIREYYKSTEQALTEPGFESTNSGDPQS